MTPAWLSAHTTVLLSVGRPAAYDLPAVDRGSGGFLQSLVTRLLGRH